MKLVVVRKGGSAVDPHQRERAACAAFGNFNAHIEECQMCGDELPALRKKCEELTKEEEMKVIVHKRQETIAAKKVAAGGAKVVVHKATEPAKKAHAATKTASPAKKAVTKRTVSAETDEFGYREGSKVSKALHFFKTGKFTMAQVIEKLGGGGHYFKILKAIKEAGHKVVEDDKRRILVTPKKHR